MKKPSRVMVGLGCLMLVLAWGCQTLSKGPSDEELIAGVLSTWKAGVQAKNIDRVMAVHSENFESSEATGKEAHRDVMMGYIEAGYLDDAEVELESAEVKVEGDKASVTGVELVTVVGTFELEFGLQKENGAWLITGFEYY